MKTIFNTIITIIVILCTISLTVLLHEEAGCTSQVDAWLSSAAISIITMMTIAMCCGIILIDCNVYDKLEKLFKDDPVARIRKELLDIGYIIGEKSGSTVVELSEDSFEKEVEISNSELILLERGIPVQCYTERDDIGNVRSSLIYKGHEVSKELDILLCDLSHRSDDYTPMEYIEL